MMEKKWMAYLCKDAIRNLGIVQEADMASFFLPKFTLLPPRLPTTFVVVAENRLSFELPLTQPSLQNWVMLYSSASVSGARLGLKQLQLDILDQTRNQVLLWTRPEESQQQQSFLNVLAKLLDAIYPTHQLPTAVLGYPLSAPTIIRKRLETLGLYAAPKGEDPQADASKFDANFVLRIVDQIRLRHESAHRFSFEITVPERVVWIAGKRTARKIRWNL